MGRAMIKTPKVFLFDEPLSNLDATLRGRNQDRGEEAARCACKTTTVFYVTHDQLEAMTLADKIVVMRAGHIEQIGTPPTSITAGQPFRRGFIGAPTMNLLPMRVVSTSPLRLTAEGIDLTSDPTRFGPLPRPGGHPRRMTKPKDLLIGRPDDAPGTPHRHGRAQ